MSAMERERDLMIVRNSDVWLGARAAMLWAGMLVGPGLAAPAAAVAVAKNGESVWIQVGSRAGGVGGSQWRTDLGLRSIAAAVAAVEVRLYPPDGSAVKSLATTVDVGAQAMLADVVGQLGFSGSAALEVRSDQPVVVTSRTYNLVSTTAACTPGGTFGQDYAAYRVGEGLGNGGSAWLAGLAEDSRSRTNLALTNMGAAAATIKVELFDGAGVSLATFNVNLGPGQYRQETQVFKSRAGQTALASGSARVTVIAGAGVIASASLIDNKTNDPTTVAMVPAGDDETPAEEITVTLPGNVPLVLVRIPAGTFLMGSPSGERGRDANETQHQVTLTQDYYLGKLEVTQQQWAAVMGSNPSHFSSCGLDCPVEQVAWNAVCGGPSGAACDAASFVGKLNTLLGTTKFRLPTEAEWERAARGGTTTEFSFPAPPLWNSECGSFPEAADFMWWCNNSGNRPHAVGQKQANPLGLHDMHGNVLEWVGDNFGAYGSTPVTDPQGPASQSGGRVMRGGGWGDTPQSTRSAARTGFFSSGVSTSLGFRLARSL
jgi:formylglycine-generating enzyme required for sulfatase activity